jgi:hypothetical protein
MKTVLLLNASVLLMLTTGCNLVHLVKGELGSGVSATEEREVGEFDKLDFSGAANIIIACGQSPSLTVTTDDNLLPFIETRVVDGTLKVSITKRINPRVTPTYQITTGNISHVEMAGSGNITVTDIEGKEFHFDLAGSGKLNASGVVERVDIDIAGSGSVDLQQLVARNVSVEIAGSGKGTVHATETLDVEIAGSGNIEYVGSPEIRKEIAGSGRVRQVQSEMKAEAEVAAENNDSGDLSP